MAGIAIKPTENVDIAVDVQQVLYSGVASVSNPLLPNLVQAALGDDAGAGFLAPGVTEQHLTFGLSKLLKGTQEISLAITAGVLEEGDRLQPPRGAGAAVDPAADEPVGLRALLVFRDQEVMPPGPAIPGADGGPLVSRPVLRNRPRDG